MITKQCDLCKKVADRLMPLNDDYKTDDIKELCYECTGKYHEIKWDEEKRCKRMQAKKVKKFFKDNAK